MKPPRRPEWSVEDHALFAARRDFELLRLVVSDKKIWTAARRMGLFSHSHSHPTPAALAAANASAGACPSVGGAGAAPAAQSGCHVRPPRRPVQRARLGGRDGQSQPQPLPICRSAADAADDAAKAAAPVRGQPADAAVIGNARQRRSAARSAQRHAARQRFIRSRVLAVLAFGAPGQVASPSPVLVTVALLCGAALPRHSCGLVGEGCHGK